MKNTPEIIAELEKIGFALQFRSKKYQFKDVTAHPFQDYIFFKYSGKEIPIVEDLEQLKQIISGIYGARTVFGFSTDQGSVLEQILTSVEKLKIDRPDLVEVFSSMDRNQLEEQVWKEVLDAINMESRVSLFMALCTNDMSKTTYTLESIKSMVESRQAFDISEFCKTTLEDTDGMDVEEIRNYLQEEVSR